MDGPQLTGISETSAWTIIRIESDQPFIIGGNRYVLHVGDVVFEHSRHPEGMNASSNSWWILMPGRRHQKEDAVLVYGLYEGNMTAQGRLSIWKDATLLSDL